MATPAGPTPPRPSRHERTRRIRRLAVTWTVVAFAAVWGVIYVQMRDGRDPALGTGVVNAAATTSAPADVPVAPSAPADVEPDDGYGGGGPGYGGGGVTTRQS